MSKRTNKSSKRWRILLCTIILLTILGSATLILGKYVWNQRKDMGAIVSNGAKCGNIGKHIINEGGSAVDSIIAVLVCEGAILPHSVGIGGGFIATIYNKQQGKIESLIAREMAPAKANLQMFQNISSESGGLAIAIPGEIKGYWEMHQKYGKLEWNRLFEPTIKLCLKGHPITIFLYKALKSLEGTLRNKKPFYDLFFNSTSDKLLGPGDYFKQLKLAETLQLIADKGADVLYGGELGEKLVKDIADEGGIITIEDLKRYKVKWATPSMTKFMNYDVYSSPLPGSGVVLSMILNVIDSKLTDDVPLLWHRLTESMKHAYGRKPLLGDVDKEPQVQSTFNEMMNPIYAYNILKYINDNVTYSDISYYGTNYIAEEDHGTASMSVLHPNGDAVSITSTINLNFGSKVLSPSTGIILNSNMDDFSKPGKSNHYGYPPSPNNFIKPFKRPLSSMCPTIIVDQNGDVQMMVGGTGGSKIPTSIAQVIVRYLYLNETLYDSIQAPRFHHQLTPNVFVYEQGFDDIILRKLARKGHFTKEFVVYGFATVTGIGSKSSVPEPVFDNRRGGSSVKV